MAGRLAAQFTYVLDRLGNGGHRTAVLLSRFGDTRESVVKQAEKAATGLAELLEKGEALAADSRLHSVQSSCGYEFTINRMSAVEALKRRLEASKRRFCASLNGLVSLGMPPEKALQMCKANADEQLCKACLGLK